MEEGNEKDILTPFSSKTLNQDELRSLNPIKLAYVGDAIYELYIRTYILDKFNLKIKDINKKCITYVKATAQAQIVNHIIPMLNEEEQSIIKKGRNAPIHSYPKNTSIIEYKMATGYEALLGYLYLDGNTERIEEIITAGINFIEEKP